MSFKGDPEGVLHQLFFTMLAIDNQMNTNILTGLNRDGLRPLL